MACQMIKFRLTEEGKTPDFLYCGLDGIGSVYGVIDPDTAPPRNLVQVGIANDGAIGDFEVIPTKVDLLAYLTTVNNTIPFDPSAATDWAWGRLDYLNGI